MIGMQSVSLFALLLLCLTRYATCFRSQPLRAVPKRGVSMTLSAAATQIAIGTAAGIAGTLVSYPLETLKTKAQVEAFKISPSEAPTEIAVFKDQRDLNGLYGGVSVALVMQLFLKASAYGGYLLSLALMNTKYLKSMNFYLKIAFAAACTGLGGSFVVTIMDRIKVLLQTDTTNLFSSAAGAAEKVVAVDGAEGLVTRGLLVTMLKECLQGILYYFTLVPLIRSSLRSTYGAPAVYVYSSFAAAVAALLLYPLDSLKTKMQYTLGSSIDSEGKGCMLETGSKLQKQGMGVFYGGAGLKFLHTFVNSLVTFTVFEGIFVNRANIASFLLSLKPF